MTKSIKEVKASSKITRELLDGLSKATREKGVENSYWQAIRSTFKHGQPSDSDDTDGYIDIKFVESDLFLLMEFKFEKHLEKRLHAMEVIIQTVFYMHSLRDKLAKVPNMIFIGDKHSAFVMNTKPLLKYLDHDDVDWTVSPSHAAAKYRAGMVVDLYNDSDINYYLHYVGGKDFKFQDLIDDIATLMSDNEEKIKLTPSNINAAFDQFINQVLTNHKKFTAEELVSLFITIATDRKNNVYENEDGSKLKVNNTSVSINKSNYRSFIGHFQERYKPSEKRMFTETSDRLIQDLQRRSSGEFYTPSAFVNYATSRLSKHLGDNWNNEFVVWDPAWGTGNLTRDSHFEKLFVSTLHKSDLDQGKQYNTNASKFVFDFLNDDVDFENDNLFGYKSDKLPQELIDIFVNHPDSKICIFMNPPYGTAGNNKSGRKSKAGISKTKIQIEMRDQHLKVQEQLYAQFLYRVIKMKRLLNLNNIYIGLFSPSLLLTGTKYNKFRDLLFDNFEYVEGNLFEASNFADVSNNWAINFSIWKAGKQDADKRFVFDSNIIKLNTAGDVSIVGHKLLYNTDNENGDSLQEFLKKNTDDPSEFTKKVLQFSSRYSTKGKVVEEPQNAIGYIINDTNNVEASAMGSYLMHSPITRHLKSAIITANTFADQMVVFASRKNVESTWINQKDEFLAPKDVNSEVYTKLRVKSVIYSIFSSANNIMSYRSDYHGAGVINLNNWFFMNADDMKSLADEYNNDRVYNDAVENANSPIALRFIDNSNLDEKDTQLIKTAREIVRDSFKFRNIINDDSPEYAVNTWDASWNQILKVANQYIPEKVKEFNKLFNKYQSDISDLIYENGILLTDRENE